jgi:hypothetical protein
MTYYSLQQSHDVSVMAQFPKAKEVLHLGDMEGNLILPAKSALSDLFYLWDVGFSFTLVVSGKLKQLLAGQSQPSLAFTQYTIFQNSVAYEDYWVLNIPENNSLKANVAANFLLLRSPDGYIVSESLKKRMESAKCTGITFAPVELSLNEWIQDRFFSIKSGERSVRRF